MLGSRLQSVWSTIFFGLVRPNTAARRTANIQSSPVRGRTGLCRTLVNLAFKATGQANGGETQLQLWHHRIAHLGIASLKALPHGLHYSSMTCYSGSPMMTRMKCNISLVLLSHCTCTDLHLFLLSSLQSPLLLYHTCTIQYTSLPSYSSPFTTRWSQ